MDSSLPFTTGDWVVHLYYGVGQIKAIEEKPIDGEKQDCYKVKTKNSTFWFPTIDEDKRPLNRALNYYPVLTGEYLPLLS